MQLSWQSSNDSGGFLVSTVCHTFLNAVLHPKPLDSSDESLKFIFCRKNIHPNVQTTRGSSNVFLPQISIPRYWPFHTSFEYLTLDILSLLVDFRSYISLLKTKINIRLAFVPKFDNLPRDGGCHPKYKMDGSSF